MVKMEIVPITREHFESVYGHTPSRTIRGYAGLVDGDTAGVAGVYYMEDHLVAFCNCKPEYANLTYQLGKATIRVLQYFRSLGRPVFAIADKKNPKAESFLMRCGFQYLNKGPNGEVFVCLPH